MPPPLVPETADLQERRTVATSPAFLKAGPLTHQMPSSSVSTGKYPYTVPDAEGEVVVILNGERKGRAVAAMPPLLVAETAHLQKGRTIGTRPAFLKTGPLTHQMPSSSVSTGKYLYTVPDAEGEVFVILNGSGPDL
ncbi:hypothetical protein HPB52_008117 [Rhipicephalus sanguineus]|uniref:Uncharacterized protein n=1 Tax=Rhipicephalus sanguineus TaxID=34632 RepID=A0A9D4QIB6_RHISA|nr:hypothetical protein HPB52_008117 [Rhipicephalus sanguineus]